MIGTRRPGVRYLGAMIASVIALNLYTPLSTASAAAVPEATCACSITLHPVSGPRGTSVTITGTGFSHHATVTLQFVDAALVRVSLGTAATGPQGGFTKIVNIPDSAALGHGYVVAFTGSLKARANFLVEKSCATKAAITLSPTSGKRGSTVEVKGSGFCPSTRVRLRFRDNKLNWTLLALGVTVNGAGTFDENETIPSGAAIGDGYVAAYDASSDQGAKKPFTVKR
jgi:hypothetical protein